MAKYNPTTVSGGFSQTKINENFDDISTAIEKTLSRDGTGPNQMEADLDMNSNPILNVGGLSLTNDIDMNGFKLTNLGSGTNPSDSVNKNQAEAIAASAAASIVGNSGALDAMRIPFVAAMVPLDLTLGEVVETSGYYVQGDGGGAKYEVVAGGTGTANGGEFIDLDNGLQAKMIIKGNVLNILQWGATEGGTIDCTDAIQNALSTGRTVLIPEGRFLSDRLYMEEDQTLMGFGRDSVLVSSGQFAAVSVNNRTTVRDFSIIPSTTDRTFTHPDDDFDDPDRNFLYKDTIVGIDGAGYEEIVITGMYIAQLWRGIGLGACKRIQVYNNLIKWVGVWQTQFFDCEYLVFDSNHCLYGGASGGVAASSVKKAVFSNNVVIGSGTGINTGGSPTAGFNVQDVTVTGNYVMARDCINLENGVEYASVTGNVCVAFENRDLPGTTGVGVACTSDSSGTAAGLVSHVTIVGNKIRRYSRNFAIGVTVRTQALNYTGEIEGIVIANNEIQGASFGITVGSSTVASPATNVTIQGNTVQFPTKAFQITNARNVILQSNQCEQGGSTPLSGFEGFDINDCILVDIQDNFIRGFGTGVSIDADCFSVFLENNSYTAHRVSNTKGTRVATFTLSYFNSDEGNQTIMSTDNRLIVNGPFVNYSPPSSTTINGLVGGFARAGKTVNFKWNGNVTLQNGSSLSLLTAVNVTPPNGSYSQFVVVRDGVLQEVSRSF